MSTLRRWMGKKEESLFTARGGEDVEKGRFWGENKGFFGRRVAVHDDNKDVWMERKKEECLLFKQTQPERSGSPRSLRLYSWLASPPSSTQPLCFLASHTAKSVQKRWYTQESALCDGCVFFGFTVYGVYCKTILAQLGLFSAKYSSLELTLSSWRTPPEIYTGFFSLWTCLSCILDSFKYL